MPVALSVLEEEVVAMPCDECPDNPKISDRLKAQEDLVLELREALADHQKSVTQDVNTLKDLIDRRHRQARRLIIDSQEQNRMSITAAVDQISGTIGRIKTYIEGEDPDKSMAVRMDRVEQRNKFYDKLIWLVIPFTVTGVVTGLWGLVIHYLPGAK